MALVSDVTTVAYSGLNHIDALLASGPGWNWLTPARNVLYYSFSVTSGNETGNSGIGGVISPFNAAQQNACLSQLAYVSQLTGITFAAAADGAAADLHFAAADILAAGTTGLCSWSHTWSYDGNGQSVTGYSASAHVYLDNAEWDLQNANPTPGSAGYETLLHELGHALGLKHPFQGQPRLAPAQDNTANTIMSYADSGGPHARFSPYDVAALMWLYGGDGLGGAFGVSTQGDYLVGDAVGNAITGSSGNDKLAGLAGDDRLDGGGGLDVAIYAGNRAGYSVERTPDGYRVGDASGREGVDLLVAVERLQFTDLNLALDTSGNAGQAYRLYQAAFDRKPDAGGLGDWIEFLDRGASLADAAAGFVDSAEFKALYGAKPTTEELVNRFYQNVLHRAPEQSGFDYWVHQLDAGFQSAPVALSNFSESPENQANLIGLIGGGIEYIPWAA